VDGISTIARLCQHGTRRLARMNAKDSAPVEMQFVVDSGADLRVGKFFAGLLSNAFGKQVVIQRCRAHKLRNVEDQLPEVMRPSVRNAVQEACRSRNVQRAKRLLGSLALGCKTITLAWRTSVPARTAYSTHADLFRHALTMVQDGMLGIRNFRMPKLGKSYPISRIVEAVFIFGLFLFNFYSFELSSSVNGPGEVFGQDSVWILQSLANHQGYPWNPQNHILYHLLVKAGYKVWEPLWGGGLGSAYIYLKLFTAFFGLLFFISLRSLFQQLNLSTFQRILLMSFSAASVSIWFHFSAFETHCVAMPALVLYIRELVRLRDNQKRNRMDRILLVGSLLVCGWTRVDLFRFALLTPPLFIFAKAKQHWRTLVVDMSIVCILGLAGNSLLSSLYFRQPPWKTTTRVLARWDRPDLKTRMQRLDNLSFSQLQTVGRAITLYGILSPVDNREPKGGFFAVPEYRLNPSNADNQYDETKLYLAPARNMLGTAISATALLGIISLFVWAAICTTRRLIKGDLLHCAVALQAIGGWLVYTWFNPVEPFLWVVEFVPLWVTVIADSLRDRPRNYWALMTAVALFVGLHNYFAFYLSFK
jgi:hypothetical protein